MLELQSRLLYLPACFASAFTLKSVTAERALGDTFLRSSRKEDRLVYKSENTQTLRFCNLEICRTMKSHCCDLGSQWSNKSCQIESVGVCNVNKPDINFGCLFFCAFHKEGKSLTVR